MLDLSPGLIASGRRSTARAVAGAVWRNTLRLRRNRASLMSALVIPGLFMLAFWVVFGHAASTSGFDYALFLMAASMFQAVLFTAGGSAMALAVDAETGLLDRLRSMPIQAMVAVGGRMLTDLLRAVLSVTVVVAIGLLCGAAPASAGGLALAYLVTLAMGEVLVLAFCGLTLRARHPVPTASLIQSVEMQLLMLSTAFIPLFTLPGWLRPIIQHLQFSVLIDTNRALLSGQAPGVAGWEALIWLVAGLVLGCWWVSRAFRGQA